MDIFDYSNVDAILTLGGEPKEMPRSRAALNLYKDLSGSRESLVPIVVSGYCSGLMLVKPSRTDSEAAKMKKYLLERDVPEEVIQVEDKSLDTLANFILSKPILDNLSAKDVAVIVDDSGMERAIATGKRVLGSNYTLRCVPVTEGIPGLFDKIKESLVLSAIIFDLKGIEPGDTESFNNYIKTRHPFHSENIFSAYGLGVVGMKTLNALIPSLSEVYTGK